MLCFAVKVAIDVYTNSPRPFLTMEIGRTDPYFWSNMGRLAFLLPFLVNGGTLLAFFLLPSYDKTVRALKGLAAVFVIGNFSFGIITEYRIWFEMIPFALYSLDLWSGGVNSLDSSGVGPSEVRPNPN